jgi:hypothetical protein
MAQMIDRREERNNDETDQWLVLAFADRRTIGLRRHALDVDPQRGDTQWMCKNIRPVGRAARAHAERAVPMR